MEVDGAGWKWVHGLEKPFKKMLKTTGNLSIKIEILASVSVSIVYFQYLYIYFRSVKGYF